MNYKQSLENLRKRVTQNPHTEYKPKTSLIQVNQSAPQDNRRSEDILSVSSDWVRTVRAQAEKAKSSIKKASQVAPAQDDGGGFAGGLISTIKTKSKSVSEDNRDKEEDVADKTEAPKKDSLIPRRISEAKMGSTGKGYGEISQSQIEGMIREEARARNIDPDTAVAIFRSEGAGAYQSQIQRSGKGSEGGLEASYGPYQLFTGGGLGNEYEQKTGRVLSQDNSWDGIVNQTRFALDKAAQNGWGAWYGRKTAGVGVRDGLQNAKTVGNWS